MRFLALVFVALFLGAVAGCGQKGPLYIPDEEERQEIEKQEQQKSKKQTQT